MDTEVEPVAVALIAQAGAVVDINTICRLCGLQTDKFIGFYSEEGLSHDLPSKVNLYLPVKMVANDELPQQCCWNCASTLLAWHDLVMLSAETDRRLRTCHLVSDKDILSIGFDDQAAIVGPQAEPMEPDPLTSRSLNDFCQTQTTTTTATLTNVVVETLSQDSKKSGKQQGKRKRKQDLAATRSYFSSEVDSTSLDTYISDIEQQLIVENNLSESVNASEFKIEIDELKLEEDEEKQSSNAADDAKNESTSDSSDDNDEDDPDDDFSPSAPKSEDELAFACPHCAAVFALKDDVFNHMKKQHASSPLTEPIPQKNTKQLIRRERRRTNKLDQEVANAAKMVVDGRVYYNCKECGKSLHSPYTYIWHMRIHTGERPFVCDLCGKQFRVSQGLVRHLRETHQGIKKFPCDLCGRMFATRRNVEEHRRIHTNERPYICDLCGKSFKQKASLFVHNRSHKNHFPFVCLYCNQGFRTKAPLMVHITRHTGEKPYKCETCGRSFRIKYELKRHRLIHSDEKPFVCNLCGLCFRQKRYLRNHTKSNHTTTATTT